MLRLSRKSILAIEAVLDVAYNARPDPVQARDITARQGVPHRYLEQVLQRLVRDGVLKGVRGPRGGYTLARERRKVTVGDIVRVVAQMDAELDDTRSQGALFAEVVSPFWLDMQSRIFAEMDGITMEQLCQQAEQAEVPRADTPDADFTI